LDTEKWKSVAVPAQVYRDLKEMAEKDHRTLGKQMTYLVELYNKLKRKQEDL